MNLLLLMGVMRLVTRGWWVPVGALMALSVEMQMGAGLRECAVLNAGLLLVALLARRWRK